MVMGDIAWFFTTYDGYSNVAPPYDGYGLVNGELKQQSTNSSVFLMDWISPSYTEVYWLGMIYHLGHSDDVYGMVSLNISSTDSDGNGVVDWMQKTNQRTRTSLDTCKFIHIVFNKQV